jgi:hypothetical protein
MRPAEKSGTWKRRLRPRAAPRNSAMSVDIEITSACTHRPLLTHRGYCSRQSSGRLRPVTMPSFADRYWMSIAMRFAASTTQSRR